MKNIAFIDGQNLHMGTSKDNWKIDFSKLFIYLKENYSVVEAYYFLGYQSKESGSLCKNLKKAGFIVIFKEHQSQFISNKKGNVDSDIIFEIMKNLIETKDFDKVILISSDGDYKKTVDYLILKNKFKKVLFPNVQNASSLYKKLGSEYFDYMISFKKYVEYINKKGS